MSNQNRVCIFVEHRNGKLQDVSLELISAGKKIAHKLNAKLTALLLGKNTEHLVETLIEYGAAVVLTVGQPLLDYYNLDAYTKVISDLIIERDIEILLIGATSRGKNLALKISSNLGIVLTTNCISLDIDSETKLLTVSRKTLRGNIDTSVKTLKDKANVFTVIPGVFKKKSREIYAGTVERISVNLEVNDIIE